MIFITVTLTQSPLMDAPGLQEAVTEQPILPLVDNLLNFLNQMKYKFFLDMAIHLLAADSGRPVILQCFATLVYYCTQQSAVI